MTQFDFLELLKEVSPDVEPKISGIAAPFTLYRYDKGDERYYFQYTQGSKPIPYLSVTEFTKKSLPTSVHLMNWKMNLGNDVSKYVARMKAEYGTFMHIAISEILKNGVGDFDKIGKDAFDCAIELGYKHEALNWQSEIVRDIASFMLFMQEKEVEVISVEYPIASRKYRLGGCIDLVCRLKFNGKIKNAIVDFKSGRKGFWDSHKLQLSTYKTIWNEHHDAIFPVEMIFNWSPSGWRKKPSYKFENQTNSVFEKTVVQRMLIANQEGWINPPKGHLEVRGAFTLADFNFNNHLNFVDYE